MERVARISKLTIDNFEQMLMTFEGLTYEENTPEILSALKILQEQLNKRVMELDVSYKVEEPVEEVVVEEEYSEDFINALANEFIKNGTVRFLTQPSPKLVDLVQDRVQEIKNSQEINQPASVQDELIAEEPVEATVNEAGTDVPYSAEYVDELAHEMLETGRLSMLTPPDPVLLGLVNDRLKELKSQLDELTEKITIPAPQEINPDIVEGLAQQLVKVGSLKFLSSPSKELVDAVNARAAEIRREIGTNDLEGLNKLEEEIKTEKKEEQQEFDAAYVDELAHRVIETGGISFLTKPPKGLLKAVDARVIELRKAEKKDLVPEKVVEKIDEIEEKTKEEPQTFDPEYVDKLARHLLETGRVSFLSRPPAGLWEVVQARMAEIKAEQNLVNEVKEEQSQFDPEYVDELAQQMITTGRISFLSKPPEGLMEAVHSRVAEIRAMMNQEDVNETPSYDPAYIDFLAQEVIRTGKLNFTEIPPEGLMTAINNRVIELRKLESQNESVVTK